MNFEKMIKDDTKESFEIENEEKEKDELISYSLFENMMSLDAKIYHKKIREGD